MPIYEYQCEQCDEVIEVRQGISEDKLQTCEEAKARTSQPTNACGKADAPVKRLVSNTSFVLKGSGWYKTDYAGNSSAKSDSSSGASTSESGGGKSSEGGGSSSKEGKSSGGAGDSTSGSAAA